MSVTGNYQRVKEKIPEGVVLIAVSKKQPIEKLEELYQAGHRDFGENYAQELKARAEHFLAKGLKDIRWHFIGHLQRNKVKMILPYVSAIHTVDSESLFQEIQKRVAPNQSIDLFLEANMDSEESKSGVSPAEIEDAVKRIGAENLKGLMCIPSPGSEDAFARLRKLRDLHLPKGGLSMGMSADYLVAIQEGATHVRVGTTIFGERS